MSVNQQFKNLFSRNSRSDNNADDLGLSSSASTVEGRILNHDGSFNMERKGERNHIYHTLISMGWWEFLGYVVLFFTLINGGFALVYYALGVDNIHGIHSEGFILNLIDLFHFSVQTMTTVGYGHMYPISSAQSVISSIHALVGLLTFALATGLVYGRFSNPKADIKYSSRMLLVDHPKMGRTLQVRLANRLSHDLLQADAQLLVLHNKTKENKLVKRYKDLKLELNHIYFLPLNWTLVHKIDETSPLHKMTLDDLKSLNAEFLLLVSAFDDTFSQMVYSRTSYTLDEVVDKATWDMAYSVNDEGVRVFDINKVDDYKLID